MDAVVETAGLTKVFRDFWHRDKVRAVDDFELDRSAGRDLWSARSERFWQDHDDKAFAGTSFPNLRNG